MKSWARIGLALAGVLAFLGTYWAFLRGGKDFFVFYEAWRLVLAGKGGLIYVVSPDRFLYAPGFAWIFAPLGLLPRDLALGLWSLLKVCAIGLMFARIARAIRVPAGIAAFGAVLMARPFLIDFQYGQVNLFIVAVSAWALLRHFDCEPGNRWDRISWAALAIAAVAKVFPLPLLLVPFFFTRGIHPDRIRHERLGIVLGLAIILLLPFAGQGFEGGLRLYSGWYEALLARGMPIESHNQSFIAFLKHYFSGEPTPILAQGMRPVLLGVDWFSAETIRLLSTAWTFSMTAFILGWLVSGPFHSATRWTAIMIGLLIVPSHLVWKPYFVMALPAAAVAVYLAFFSRALGRWRGWAQVFVLLLFAGINFTGFDFVGQDWSARFEAGSLLLLLHLALLCFLRFSSLLLPSRLSDRT